MLTAKEARDIANTGLPALNAKVEEVSKEIEYAASSGLFEVEVFLANNEITYVGRTLGRMGYQYLLRDYTDNEGKTEVVVSWYEDGRWETRDS